MRQLWVTIRKDVWLWLLVAIGLMSGSTSIFREWLSIVYPGTTNTRGLFDACLISCFFVAAVLVFARQRSSISLLEGAEQRDKAEREKLRQVHEQMGRFMLEGEGLAREWRAGLREYGLWLRNRRAWIERVSDYLSNLGLPDEGSALRHSVESDPDIAQLQGPNQALYWHRFYGSQLNEARTKLAEIVARRFDFRV